MGRGSSKIGGSGGGGAMKLESVSGKPFDEKDWTTWPVGTRVDLVDTDISAMDDRGATKTFVDPGVVTEVHEDYIVVHNNALDINGYISTRFPDMMDRIRNVRKPKK